MNRGSAGHDATGTFNWLSRAWNLYPDLARLFHGFLTGKRRMS
jgi:hypothetical protein